MGAVLLFVFVILGSTAMGATYTVTNTNDSGAGSLRQALIDANGNAGMDTIEFSIPGTGVYTISLSSALPYITNPVIIDGYTQPGAYPATEGSPAALKIVLDGSSAGTANGFYISTTGGGSTIRGLVINQFSGDGIHIVASSGNMIEGNYIGTDAAGTSNLGNGSDGVEIYDDSDDNTVGGTDPSARNIIVYNGRAGISVSSSAATGNAILGNTIFSNTGLGIDLGSGGSADGVTLNDNDDPDSGANNLQNFPVLTRAVSGGVTTVSGTLNSVANRVYRLEFFANSALDSTGYGEGAEYVGTTDVITNSGGDASFSYTLTTTAPVGWYITATATDAGNNTSEFSAGLTVSSASADLAVTIVDGPDPVQVGDQITYTIGVQNNGPDTATGVTLTDNLPAQVSYLSATASQGAVSVTGTTVTANLGTLASGNSATVTVVVTAISTGTATNSPSVTGNEADPNNTDNTATTTTTIFSLSADLLVTASDAPDPATVGSTLTYTFTVTNNGPNTATGVILTDTLPAQVSYLSATASQGTVSETGGTVTATIETLQKGHAATVTIIVNVVTAEDMSNTTTVSGNESDPNTSNNSVTNTTAANQPPSANAGSVQYVNTGDTVQLNGSGSSDPDGDSLTYSWRFVSVPGGSTAAIYPADSTTPTFSADLFGDYIIELTVNDGQGGMNSSEVTITASSGDVNQDGKVDAQDTLLAAKISLGLITPTAYQEKAANVAYPYTVIDARDVVRIAEIALGIPSKSVVLSANNRSMSTVSHAFHLTCREVTVGERATLTLSGTEVFSGLQAGPEGSLRFDPSLIQIEAIRGISPYSVLASRIDNNLGEAHFIAIGPTSPRSGRLVEIEFVAIGSGGEATIYLALDTILDANGNVAGTAYINGKITLLSVAPLSINHVLNAPNPACNSTEFLAVGQGINEIAVQVYDLSGHLVFTSSWVANGFTWDIINEEGEQLANGIYLYVVTVRGFNTKTLARGAVRKLVVLR